MERSRHICLFMLWLATLDEVLSLEISSQHFFMYKNLTLLPDYESFTITRLTGRNLIQCAALCAESAECCTMTFYSNVTECVFNSHCCPSVQDISHEAGVTFLLKNPTKCKLILKTILSVTLILFGRIKHRASIAIVKLCRAYSN